MVSGMYLDCITLLTLLTVSCVLQSANVSHVWCIVTRTVCCSELHSRICHTTDVTWLYCVAECCSVLQSPNVSHAWCIVACIALQRVALSNMSHDSCTMTTLLTLLIRYVSQRIIKVPRTVAEEKKILVQILKSQLYSRVTVVDMRVSSFWEILSGATLGVRAVDIRGSICTFIFICL